jgi:hypothetical protein
LTLGSGAPGCGLDSNGSEQGWKTDTCEHCIELFRFLKAGNFLTGWVIKFLYQDLAPWSKLTGTAQQMNEIINLVAL